MPMRNLSHLALLLVISAGCSTTPKAALKPGPTDSDKSSGGPAASVGTLGVVAPADFTELSIWPQAYKGELLVLEAAPQGTPVAAGDPIVQLDTTAIDGQIASAELELQSAQVKHDGLLERHRIAEEAAQAKLARSRTDLGRAQMALEGYETFEVAFDKRGDDLSAQRERARVDDQVDELGQLEAMYNADELTDATEDIVLKREQRNLNLLKEATALSEDQRKYRNDFGRKMDRERRQETVAQEQLEVDHLVRTQTTEEASRVDARTRSSAELTKKSERLTKLRADRDLFTVAAPHAGTVLHGHSEQYRPGASPTWLERASEVRARRTFALVMHPGKLAVAVDLPESRLTALGDGTTVQLQPMSGGASAEGKVSVADYPRGQKGQEALYRGWIPLSGASTWAPGNYVKISAGEDTK